jgi:hypothetical protein
LASGQYSHSEGFQTTASGIASHAEGANTLASGDGSHAEGNNTTASGTNSHAKGNNTTASGNNSHAEGSNTIATASTAHAQGIATSALGIASHAGGSGSKAESDYSFAHGLNTTATADSSAILGGVDHEIISGGDRSAILGGDSNKVNASVVNSIVLGGSNMTATTSNTVYIPNARLAETSGSVIYSAGTDLYNIFSLAGAIDGSGTTDYIPKFSDSDTLTDSQIKDDGTTVSINNASPDSSFTLYVSGDTKVIGSFEADSKSFDIIHPTKEGKRLRYGSLEGPEYGVYVRGKLSGENIIELPEHWTGLVDENSITVQLTPHGRKQDLFVGEIINNTVEVLGDDNPECYYIVLGERKDIDRITVEY